MAFKISQLFFCVINLMFSGSQLLASELTLSIQPQCELFLDNQLDNLDEQLSHILTGYGHVRVLKTSDILHVFASDAFDSIKDYVRTLSPFKEDLLVFLPETANHFFQTPASTYLGFGNTFLKASNDQRWYALDLIEPNASKALHFAVFQHDVDSLVLLHEVIHLMDMDSLYRFATKFLKDANHRLMIRADVFRIIKELRAYKMQYRAFKRFNPKLAHEYAKFLAQLMHDAFGAFIEGLPLSDFIKLKKVFNINSHKIEDIVLFLEDEFPIPEIEAAFSAFDSNVLKVIRK